MLPQTLRVWNVFNKKQKKRWKNLIDYEEMNERMEFQIFLFYAQIPCHIPISSECTCTARYNNLLFNNEREWNALWRKKNKSVSSIAADKFNCFGLVSRYYHEKKKGINKFFHCAPEYLYRFYG